MATLGRALAVAAALALNAAAAPLVEPDDVPDAFAHGGEIGRMIRQTAYYARRQIPFPGASYDRGQDGARYQVISTSLGTEEGLDREWYFALRFSADGHFEISQRVFARPPGVKVQDAPYGLGTDRITFVFTREGRMVSARIDELRRGAPRSRCFLRPQVVAAVNRWRRHPGAHFSDFDQFLVTAPFECRPTMASVPAGRRDSCG
jgi:hypothetical protein